MRRAVLVLLLACGHSARPAQPPTPGTGVSRLLPPTPIDLRRPDAAYLVSIAQHVQPGWHQFLEDCRVRLPATHPLNVMTLAAFAELVIDARGNVKPGGFLSSGNHDFDEAVHDAIADVTQLPAPPRDWLADDDQLHVRWMFSRDHRQAGAATAEIIPFELPLPDIVDKRIAQHDLTRAARRILAARPIAAGRAPATEAVFLAALAEALASNDAGVQRQALEALARVPTPALQDAIRDKLGSSDRAVRLAAVNAAAGDPAANQLIVDQILRDLGADPDAGMAAIVALRQTAAEELESVARAFADTSPTPSPSAIAVFDLLPSPARAKKLAALWERGDARTRAGVCDAIRRRIELASPVDDARIDLLVERGLGERVSLVRAHCAAATPFLWQRSSRVVDRVRALTSDRDATVRAAAIAALVMLDSSHFVRAATDTSVEVRVAYAAALEHTHKPPAKSDLETLLEDPNGEVRAAAWHSYVVHAEGSDQLAKLAARAMRDDNPAVRAAVSRFVEDDAALAHAAASDDSPEVRTAALVALARRKGDTILDDLLRQLAAAPPASDERVRIALAGLLAH